MGKDDDQIHLLAKDKSEQRSYVSAKLLNVLSIVCSSKNFIDRTVVVSNISFNNFIKSMQSI